MSDNMAERIRQAKAKADEALEAKKKLVGQPGLILWRSLRRRTLML